MSSTPIRSYADLLLQGSLIFGKTVTQFPASPRDNEMVMKEGILWIFSEISGLKTWYPLTNRKNSYLHSQGAPSFQWNVTHNLGTRNVVVAVYDTDRNAMYPALKVMDDNSLQLNFTSGEIGYAVIFAEGDMAVPSVTAGAIVATSLEVGPLVANSGGVTVNGQPVATVDMINDAGNGSLTQDFLAKQLDLSGDLLPTQSGVQNIGSPTKRWKGIYVDEAHLSVNTLYLGDTPILGTDSNIVTFRADPDQNITLKTLGLGRSELSSELHTLVKTDGDGADVEIQAVGMGSKVLINANTEVAISAPTVRTTGDLNIGGVTTFENQVTFNGPVMFSGSSTEVNSTTVTVEDNFIIVNKNEPGAGVTNRYSGIEVERGTLDNSRMAWDEVLGRFVVGVIGSESGIATLSDLSAYALATSVYSRAQVDALVFNQQSNAVITYQGDVTGTGSGTIQLTLAATGVSAGSYGKVTVDAKGRVIAGSNPTTLAGFGIVDGLSVAEAVSVPTAGRLLRMDSQGRLPASVTGSADRLGTARAIAIGGAVSGSAQFDGASDVTINVALANSGATAGDYGSATKALVATVDAKGRVTSVSEQTITPAFSNVTGKPTTLEGYGITDALQAGLPIDGGEF